MSETKREYLKFPIVGIIAPAGYGKTEEIANAIIESEGKQLILTHTRAGVAAIRKRIKKKNINKDKYEIDTIAAFCLRWCKAYPKTANVTIPERVCDIDYHAVYVGTGRIFSTGWARKVLKQTYAGVFVDEYQDCVNSQHSIFETWVGVIPIRVFGDPMQGIFYWVKTDKIVNWNDFRFNVIQPLSKPWRWQNTNNDLGTLLDSIRSKLIPALTGEDVSIKLENVPGCMSIISSRVWNNGLFAYGIREYESIVYLTAFPQKQKSFSLHNGGFFQCDEKKDMSDAEMFVSTIEGMKGTDKALALLEGLKEAVNGITSEFGSYISNLQKGKSDFSRIMKHKDFGVLLKKVCDDDSPKAVLDILRWLESSQLKKYRAEYIYRIEKLYAYISEEGVSIKDAVEKLGNSERFIEKDFAFARLSSRTVLTKGLEFECVIIDIRDKMDVRDFYVAMTRATKYIYVISDNTQLSFKGVLY